MLMRLLKNVLTGGALALSLAACSSSPPWQEEFALAGCNLQPTGRNEYFVLEPGFQTMAMIAAGISAVIGLAGFAAMRAPRLTQPAA